VLDSTRGPLVLAPLRGLARRLLCACAAVGLSSAWGPLPARADEAVADVTDLDLEELLQLRVTSPGKKPERLLEVPAATYVIRGEDLRRLGVTTLPEALRMVPGFHVVRQRPSNWVISSRGFSSGNANKLLVLIDGRTVYSNLQSGVFWDVQDSLLEDVDRIEVIRGPGGALFGTNAVNGVVNVITRRADTTLGTHLGASAGKETRAQLDLRHGFAVGEDGAVRVFGKYTDLDQSARAFDHGERAEDGFAMVRGGFRSDWRSGERDAHTLQGDVYRGQAEFEGTLPTSTAPFTSMLRNRHEFSGGNLLWRWERRLGDESNLQVQAYYDFTARRERVFSTDESTGDLELQHRFQPLPRHDVVWGLGYRIARSDFDGSFALTLSPSVRTDAILNAFVQDDIELIEDRLHLTLGTKLEYGDYARLEVLPNARLGLRLAERHFAWLAASRAVRAPALIDLDFRFNLATMPGMTPTVVSAFGSDDFQPEDVFAVEAGYRAQLLDTLSLDAALFYNFYDDLRSIEPGTPFLETTPAPGQLVSPLFLDNELRGRSYGVELAANFQAAPGWRLSFNFSHLYLNLSPTKRSLATDSESDEDATPRNQVWLRSSSDLPGNLSLDVALRYLGRTPTLGVDSYAEADARLAWSSADGRYELALVGQNLLHHEHEESATPGGRPASAIQRTLFIQLIRRFR
jgi:iron complex outermembrane recepter protein